MIDVRALGPLDVHHQLRGSMATLLAQPRRAALFVYLIVEGGRDYVSRDSLLALFWPESDESRARAALRQALAFLRRSLGEETIRNRGDDAVGVDPERARCDVPRFLAAVAAGRDDEALALYRGDFLQGLVLDGAADFERWCAQQRDMLAAAASEVAARLAERSAQRGAWGEAVALVQRAQSLAPYSEAIHRQHLRLLDQSGDRAGALRVHEQFAARLAESLEARPAPETMALVQAVRERREAHSPGKEGRPASGDASTAAAGSAFSRVAGDASTPAVAAISARPVPVVLNGRWFAAAGGATLVALLLIVRPTREPQRQSLTAHPSQSASSADPRHRPDQGRLARIVVVPFDAPGAGDSTGALGRMTADWITEGISRIEAVEVVPATAVIASERSLAGNDASAGTRWQAIARDVGASVVVRGRIDRDGAAVYLQAQLVDARDGRLLRPAERVRVPAESVMAGVDRLRTRVVAAIAPLADTVTHLRRANAPPSYEAYRRYVAGLETFVSGDPAGALAHFRQSAAADPNYPMPRIASTIMLLNLGDASSAAALLAPLLAERDRLGPLEQSTLDMVRGLLQGNLAETYAAVVRQARIAPGTIGEYMVAETARRMNRPAEALAVLRRLGPDRGELRGWRPYWRELTFSLHLLGRHEEELAATLEGRRRYPADADIAMYEVRARAALGDPLALSASLSAFDGTAAPAAERGALRLAALTEWLAHDHPGAAPLLRSVAAWFDSLPADARRAPATRRQEARVRLLQGNSDSARALLRPLVNRTAAGSPPSFFTLGLAGIAAAADDDEREARRLMALIDARAAVLPPAERGLLWGEPSYWRAAIAAQLGDSLAAASLLGQARREGLGVDPSVHAEPSFAAVRRWPPFAALLQAQDR